MNIMLLSVGTKISTNLLLGFTTLYLQQRPLAIEKSILENLFIFIFLYYIKEEAKSSQ